MSANDIWKFDELCRAEEALEMSCAGAIHLRHMSHLQASEIAKQPLPKGCKCPTGMMFFTLPGGECPTEMEAK